nr:hypothetical protein GCM10017611_74640 [Rhodococcus wratislaviensis]
MQVTRVLDPASDAVSFTLLDENGVVAPAERYLRYPADIERSPNTIKAHAHDLKDWFTFLGETECDTKTSPQRSARSLCAAAVIYSPEPDTPSYSALQILSSWVAQPRQTHDRTAPADRGAHRSDEG